MAELCLGLATSHVAFITQSPEMGDPVQVGGFRDGYRRLAEALAEARPDVALVISGEHLNYFFIDNMPAFCVGVADGFEGPTERGAGIPYRRIPASVGLARFLLTTGLESGVDWARTEGWELDHGIMVPLYMVDQDARIPIVPVFINCAAPPCPTARRCYAFGEWLRDTIARWDSTKAMSASVASGLITMGWNFGWALDSSSVCFSSSMGMPNPSETCGKLRSSSFWSSRSIRMLKEG